MGGKERLETKGNKFLFPFRITPHLTNGASSELWFKPHLPTAFHLLKPDTRRPVLRGQNNMAQRMKILHLKRIFRKDDRIPVRNVGADERLVEGTITRQLRVVNFEVRECGNMLEQHVDQFMKLLTQLLKCCQVSEKKLMHSLPLSAYRSFLKYEHIHFVGK
ncbi:Hypothetical predicted protein [Octopus vulgaris]|uniref:Uncharacterized protein n=1 Tax=Octopus vulgaris TaxID=6645 RepID=A0AA36F8E9_OCTVU|nr:Hypothetical predicted protein [Octopus vulgaris]